MPVAVHYHILLWHTTHVADSWGGLVPDHHWTISRGRCQSTIVHSTNRQYSICVSSQRLQGFTSQEFISNLLDCPTKLQDCGLNVGTLEESVKVLEEELSAVNQGILCTICMERPSNIAILPCGHAAFCEECVGTLLQQAPPYRRCPNCRANITSYVRLFK